MSITARNPSARARDRELELADRYSASHALHVRACSLLPGGYHLSGRPLVDASTTPMYFSDGSGCSLRDVDGHEYTDYLMAFGAILLGYGRPEVNAAAQRQLQRGALLSLNHPLHLELVEALLNRLPGAEMAAFFKTGSEATTAALRIAREHTGRRAVARAGYHVGPGLYLTSGSFDVRIQQAGIVPPPTALGDARRTARYCA